MKLHTTDKSSFYVQKFVTILVKNDGDDLCTDFIESVKFNINFREIASKYGCGKKKNTAAGNCKVFD